MSRIFVQSVIKGKLGVKYEILPDGTREVARECSNCKNQTIYMSCALGKKEKIHCGERAILWEMKV